MKILHTADWHVGKTIGRRQRLEESKAALNQVVTIAVGEDVDAVLVCGDLFEHLAPPPEAEEIVYRALLDLERHGIPAVLVPGNHDAPRRWGAIAPLLARFSVFVVPEVRRPDQGGVLEITARDRSMEAEIACLPWVSERRMVSAVELMGLAEAAGQVYAEEMARLLDALCRNLSSDKCSILAAHFFVSGSRLGGGERSLTVGQILAVTPQALPSVQYVALGHVHRPQSVAGAAIPARYSGSLLQLDFGEAEQAKSVAVITMEPGKPVEVRELPITAGRKLLDISGTIEELEACRDSYEDAFLRVNLKCKGPQSNLGDQVRDLLPNAIVVTLDYPREEANIKPPSLRGIAPREQFARYFQERYAASADPNLLDLFDQLLDAETVE